MFITVNGLNIYYERFDGATTDTTVLLHGWGANSDTMRGIFNFLSAQNISVIMLDMPYFGKTEPPPPTYGVYEYADIIRRFITGLKLNNVNLLGHSFGGRIAIILAAAYPKQIQKIVLAGAAGIKPKRTLKYYCKVFAYKLKKRLKIQPKSAGSTDYNALPDFMKPVFVKIVNTHLNKLLPKIECPALILWGKNDLDTPLYMAKKLNKKIPDSGLVILENAGHYSFLDKPQEFYAIINSFL